MIFLITSIILTESFQNLYCYSSECTNCTLGYNYLSLSCLLYCPWGYALKVDKCSPVSTLDLFTINFASFRKFNESSINSFSNPENYTFNNLTKVTPLVTIDRGFYFYSSSYLLSATSWVIAPNFCFTMFLRPVDTGIIFQVKNETTTFFEMRLEKDEIVLEYAFISNGVGDFHQESLAYKQKNWRSVYVRIYHTIDYMATFIGSFWKTYTSREFRMDTQDALFTIGSQNNKSFQGFIA